MYVVGRVTPVTLSPLQSCDILVTQGHDQFSNFVSWLHKQQGWLTSDNCWYLYLISPIQSNPVSN